MSKFYRDQGQDFIDQYHREYAHMEAAAWQEIARQKVGELYYDDAAGMTASQLDALPHYVHTLQRLNIRRRVGFRLTDNAGWSDGIALAYDASVQTVPAYVQPAVHSLVPHLGQAVDLGRTFLLLRQRYKAVISVLDRLHVGIAIVLPNGEVIITNNEASRMLDQRDTIRLRHDRKIDLIDPDLTAKVYEMLRRSARMANGMDDVLTAPMRIEKKDGQKPLLLSMTPLRDVTAEIESDLTGVILLMIDMETPPDLDVQSFARLYGLTKAETDVCALMIEGWSTTIIAEKRSTSPHTVHNQVRAVLSKTRCQSRAQLLRLVIQTLPPIF